MHSTVCSEIRSMAVSISYMLVFRASAIAIRRVEVGYDVTLDGLGQRHEACVIAGAAQVFDRALGEILVFAADRLRHLDVTDVRHASECREHRGNEVAEALRLAGPDIEQARSEERRVG